MIKGNRFYFLANIYFIVSSTVMSISTQNQHKERCSDLCIVWIHVPAGFAHTDDSKIGRSGVFDFSYLQPFQEK